MKSPRLYSLYSRVRGTRTWTRVSPTALPKEAAVRFFQNRLLDSALSGGPTELQLRPTPKGGDRD